MSKTTMHQHERAEGGSGAGPGHGRPVARGIFLCAIGSTVALALSLTGCGPFGTASIAESCVTSAMKAAEPFGNARERAETEIQLRHYCRIAAGA